MIWYEFPVLARQVIHTFVDRTERARSALLVEVAAKALMAALRSGADEIRQLFLLVLESCRHRESPRVSRDVRSLTCAPIAAIRREFQGRRVQLL
jgi:hypothetical protein